MNEHERIWLEPAPGADEDYGRQWAQHNVWPEGIEYIRADLAESALEDAQHDAVAAETELRIVREQISSQAQLSTLYSNAIARAEKAEEELRKSEWPNQTHPDQTSPMTVGPEAFFEEEDGIEAMVLSLCDPFPSENLTRSGGIDYWREIMRKARTAALSVLPPPPVRETP